MERVVSEAQMSTSTGWRVAGKPIANGLGLNNGALPPYGATSLLCGPHEATVT